MAEMLLALSTLGCGGGERGGKAGGVEHRQYASENVFHEEERNTWDVTKLWVVDNVQGE